MTAIEKLTTLREEMKKRGADVLLVTSEDYHQSEYVGDFFKARAYISGFTGSAGTLVITADDAKLFTDGRYYIQAERQLAESTIDLMRSGSEGVPTVSEYIVSLFADEKRGIKTLAFDGRCVSARFAAELRKKLPSDAKLMGDTDYAALIWSDRPALPATKIWAYDVKYCGKSHADKLKDVRAAMKEKNCDALVMSSLCDIAWLYNLRAGDVESTPVFLSYIIITETEDKLFVNTDAVSGVRASLEADGVSVCDYGDFFETLAKLSGRVMVDTSAVSEAIVSALSGAQMVDAKNPTVIMKARKNETELENTRKAHIAEGLALTKMMLLLKFGEEELDELSAEQRLIAYRKEAAELVGVTYLYDSFGAICAFGPNAAMAHYSAAPESFLKIDKNAPVPMLLIDSGGHYLEGSTDTTRTFVLGPIPDEVKLHYTLTACGTIRLANLKFLEGATGVALDIIARQMMWEHGIDFRHGTGHGVGHLLSVHEGPNSIHWGRSAAKIEEGMITSDEPGIYVEGSHGIRIENELIAKKAEHNEFGQFMCFENITHCPIDLDGMDTSIMDESDIRKLNAYHKSVYETLSPYLDESEREKLSYLTRAI